MVKLRTAPLLFSMLAAPLALTACADDDGGGSDGAASEEDGGTGGGDGDGDGDGDGIIDYGPARGDFAIRQVEVSQSIAQPVWVDGSNVAPSDRVVQFVRNRFMVVRALWELPDGWTPRPMMARLYVTLPGGEEEAFVDYLTLTGNPVVPESDSRESQLTESFFWRIEPEYVEPGMSYRVEVLEATDASDVPASSIGNVYPPEGDTDLFIDSKRSVLKVALVGVRYDANGCVSDTSDITAEGPRADEFEALRAGFEAWNAVETDQTQIATSISVDIDYEVSGVPQLLGVVGQIRAQYAESVPDAFFYIVWDDCAPSPSGVLGIAPLGNENPTPEGADFRYASGLWNPRSNGAFIQESVNTAVHEVGHNQGAPHAPCGVGQDYDPNYPHAVASIGIRGLDPLDGQIYLPDQHTDFMSYCRPYWVSDYRWRKSFSHQTTMTSWGGADMGSGTEQGDFQNASLIGLVTPTGEDDVWWVNSRTKVPADATLLSDVSVEVETDAGTLAMPTKVIDVPDIPGAFMVEMPMYGDLDPQNIQRMRVRGRMMDLEVDAPQIRDHRDLKFTVDGELFSGLK